ncbi:MULTISPECIES: ATP/GTP-binding protein [unclassified Actinomyces]|uniref:AAA family ATPase n=1 Tax=unclassified Actinomyces TaxID=2609248 RepID=UPI000D5916E6|nr:MULTISPECIES: ATP-binding protein [unclassified Actinomyces]RAX24486.1 ATP-binding protein [Actinomyces sp. Z3]
MLLRFSVENFRSIRDLAELSMVAVDEEREIVRHPSADDVGVLPAAGIFGPNASGKTNVLRGLSWLSTAVRWSLRLWDDEVPVDPFVLLESPKPVSSFTVDLLLKGIRFEYFLDVTSEQVEYEALFYFPENNRRRLFEREGSSVKVDPERFPSPSEITRLLTRRVLLLTLLPRIVEDTDITQANSALRNIETLGVGLSRRQFIPRSTYLALDDAQAAPDTRARALALLRYADLGVTDAEVSREDQEIGSSGRTLSRTRLRLVHGQGTLARPFEQDQESAGTLEWLRKIGPALEALNRGTILLCDELDASLHPALSVELLHLFQSPETNPRGAQLIFTTHDTNLLNHLNRDEIWLTHRNDDGSTFLRALADFSGKNVEQSRGLERSYLDGAFGALPDIRSSEVQRTLGLIP